MKTEKPEPLPHKKVGRFSSPKPMAELIVSFVVGAGVLAAATMLPRGESAKPTGEQTDATPVSAIGTPLPREAEIYQTPAQ